MGHSTSTNKITHTLYKIYGYLHNINERVKKNDKDKNKNKLNQVK